MAIYVVVEDWLVLRVLWLCVFGCLVGAVCCLFGCWVDLVLVDRCLLLGLLYGGFGYCWLMIVVMLVCCLKCCLSGCVGAVYVLAVLLFVVILVFSLAWFIVVVRWLCGWFACDCCCMFCFGWLFGCGCALLVVDCDISGRICFVGWVGGSICVVLGVVCLVVYC